MNKTSSLRILTWAVILYLLLAFAWWAVLLFMKNQEVFEAKKQALRQELVDQEQYNAPSFHSSPEYQALLEDYRWQRWMIAGEASFFIISLGIGVWMINRGYHQLVSAADQQRNFLLAITHELKSPLASIRLTLETIMRRNLSGDKLHTVSQKAMQETERLDQLVNNLLLAAKMEHGFEPSYEEVDIDEIVPSVMERIRSKFPQSTFELEIERSNMKLQCDLQGLQSILINLLENAQKYCPDAGTVQLRVQEDGEDIVFTVADEGPGISDEEKEQVFKKFYRIGSEDTRKTKGSGLGLYIVKRIVDAQNGRVYIRDNQPKGSRFIVRLPQNQS